MHLAHGHVVLSATDLSNFLSCRRKVALDRTVALGQRQRPQAAEDSLLELLRLRGAEHERRFVESERARGHEIVDLRALPTVAERLDATLAAMRRGAARIVQAALSHPDQDSRRTPSDARWFGYADVLRRVDTPSPNLGPWSYEAVDTKLSRETRGATILQLALYSDMLAAIQGSAPESFYVVTPISEERYRLADYAPYFRMMREALAGFVSAERPLPYPDPVSHCEICDWQRECDRQLRKDDHLSFVAGLGRLHTKELVQQGVTTLAALARTPVPLPFVPSRGSKETYLRLREQARLQLQQRETRELAFECLPVEPDFGLSALPEPRPGDLFLDLEGDPFGRVDAGVATGEGNREYLFGLGRVAPDGSLTYVARWALDEVEERAAFDGTMADIMAALEADPDIHIFHYAPYEPSAFKRLMGRHATRETDMDRLLRGRRFIDLYAVVRHALRAGAEGYSIKNLEPYFGFRRDVELHHATDQRRLVELSLESGDGDLVTPDVRRAVEGYNRDDVRSTVELRAWLELLRKKQIDEGCEIPRPSAPEDKPSRNVDERAQKVEAVRAQLLKDVPPERASRSADQQSRFILAYLLDWHRREDKADWWEYFRLCELKEGDLIDEPRAVAGLHFIGDVETRNRSTVQRYGYPAQEIEIRRGDELKRQDKKSFGEVVAIDRERRTLDLLVGPSNAAHRPTALFAHKHVNPKVIEDALMSLGERVALTMAGAGDTLVSGGLHLAPELLPPSAARALLLRETPRLRSKPFMAPNQGVVSYATSIVTDLDRTCLPIQGPPGAGKTFAGARMIEALVAQGLKVGVTANGHKVIRNLLSEVTGARLGHRVSDDEDLDGGSSSDVTIFSDNAAAHAALVRGDVNVLGGTAWLWTRPEFAGAVDVLFIDEAGQMSLANALAVTQAASSLVLLGDPQQLEQPRKGSHPDGVGVSALDHILGGAPTMPRERGLFLSETWRLAPAICTFTSELFYDGKLTSKPGLERQRLLRREAGLFVIEVEHAGNRNASDEEADAVVALVAELLAEPAFWVDDQGRERRLTAADIRVMAPFNAQVERIREKLEGQGSRFEAPPVGTVDKFQGQTAAVSVYSMATSYPEDAPKGMEFLYSLNRLNVATSRARCEAIIVASPTLFEPDCQTPRRIRLASALVRFKELATADKPRL